jgi:hypothetical protein
MKSTKENWETNEKMQAQKNEEESSRSGGQSEPLNESRSVKSPKVINISEIMKYINVDDGPNNS